MVAEYESGYNNFGPSNLEPRASYIEEIESPASVLDMHPILKKRNNAEMVNHILKNFGNLNRLGNGIFASN